MDDINGGMVIGGEWSGGVESNFTWAWRGTRSGAGNRQVEGR